MFQIRIQLNYDINQTLDSKSWNSEFHTISLYSFMKYLAFDIKNIKDSLSRIHKYILNKFINNDKANNIKNLKSISKIT